MAFPLHQEKVHGDVGTAFLVLSHAGWVGTSLAATSIAIALLFFAANRILEGGNGNLQISKMSRQLGIVACVTSFNLTLWTLYAEWRTWISADQWPIDQRIFADAGFLFLMVVTVCVGIFNILTWQYLRDPCFFSESVHVAKESPSLDSDFIISDAG